MNAMIPREHLETWASFLIDYSLGGIQPGDVVMIKGEHITWPLLSVLQDMVFAKGGIVDLFLVPPDNDRGRVWGASIGRHGTEAQIERVPAWHTARYEAMTKYIEVLGAERPELFAGIPDDLATAIARVDEPVRGLRLLKPWVLTLYPTPGFAALEGLSIEEYTRTVVSASIRDPRELERIEEPIWKLMQESSRIAIETEHPRDGRALRLEMSIAGKRAIKCTGKRNFPDGEVFTSPDARTVEGELFLDRPVLYSGTVIEGVYLRFASGVIQEYRAERGEDALRKIIETDAGSRRLGEVAIGMNAGLERALMHPLFVEKVGGTIHVAIGASYPEAYVDAPASESGRAEADRLADEGALNRSAQHVDIVADFRPGGVGRALYLDDVRLRVEDGIWVVPGRV